MMVLCLSGQVELTMTFYSDKISITIKEIESQSKLRGDVDNYCKSIMDGLNGVAYKDDGQVLNLKRIQEVIMPSKQVKGHVSSHDIDYKAGRRVNWKNDVKIGKERRSNSHGLSCDD